MYENTQSNRMPEELSQFIHTINQKHEKNEMSADLRNIFMFQTEDMDGNITDTKFAMNLMTDVGTISDTSRGGQFRLCYAENYVPEYDKAYIQSTGDNTGWLDMANAYTDYQMSFDSETGMISQRYRDFSYTWDYNISGWNTNKTFNIIALRWSYETFNSIGAIANIVDSHGDPSTITKKLNERLTIYSFRSTSMHESVITRAWDNGIYLAITPNNCVISYYNRYYPLRAINFQLQNGITDQSEYYYNNSSSNSTPTNYHYFSNHTSYDNQTPYPINSNLYSNYGRNLSDNLTVEDHRLFWSQAAWYYSSSDIHENMRAFYFIHMNTPDEITTNTRLNLVYTDSDTTGTIGNAFGKYAVDTTRQKGVVPVTDFNMTDSKMFNYQTKAWDIQDTFVNAPDAWYDETLTNWCKSLWIYDPDNILQTYYVYINARPDIPITKLNYDSRAKVYLADKYWDTSTWTRILSGTIPAELQSKKYYITNSMYYVPYPVTRQQAVHSITPSHARYKITSTPEFPQNTSSSFWLRVKPIASDTYKFILSYKHLMFIDNGICDASFELVGDSANREIDAYQFRYLFGSNLVVAPQQNPHLAQNNDCGGIPYNVRVYDVSNYGVQPTYTDLPIPTDVCDQPKKGYYSKSENGYIGMWESGNNKAALIDMNQFAIDPTTCVKQFDDVSYFHVQEFTNYAIYFITNSSPSRLVVYDLSTDSVLQTCDYNGEYGTQIWGIIGAGDYVYIRIYSSVDSEWRTLLYRISTNSYEWMLNNDLYFRQKYNETAYDNNNDNLRYDVTTLSIVYHPDGFVLTHDTLYTNSSGGYPSGTNSEIQYITFDTPKTVRTLFYSSNTYVPGRNTSNGPESWTFYNEYSTFVSGAQIVETPSHQLLLVGIFGELRSYYNEMTSCYRRICCADLGYAFANKYTLNQCYNHFHKYDSKLQPGDIYYYRSGGACYFDNGIVYIDDGGDCYWNPLEYMLPHAITGTTTTINFYNNPRKMYLNNFRINATMTNRGNLIETPERVPDANGLVWCNGSYWWLYTYYGGNLTKDLDPKCICPDKIIKIQAGSSITVSWQLKSNVTTLAGTTPAIQYYATFFDWTTAMDNPASHYVSSLTVTNHSSQTNKSSGTTITAPSSSTGYVGFALYLRTSSDCTLSYGLFESITVTITPPA